MEVVFGKDIRIINYNTPVFNWCQENLTLDNPMYITLKRLGKEDTIRRKRVPEKLKLYVIKDNTMIIPYGCLRGIWPLVKNCARQLNFNSTEDISIKNLPCVVKMEGDYSYQKAALEAMVKAKGGILMAPCGSGKSNLGLEIIHSIGKKFLWLTHTSDLLEQTYRSMKSKYPMLDIGKITEGNVHIGKDGAIATVQTLVNVDKEVYEKEFEVIVCDECHHVASSPDNMRMFAKIINNIPARYKYGLTATPKRSDTLINSMYMYLGMNIEGEFRPTYKVNEDDIPTMKSTHVAVNLGTEINFDDIFTLDGTIEYSELIKVLSEDENRNIEIVKNVKKCDLEGRKQVVLCNLVSHCKVLNEMFQKEGINSVCCTGSTTNKKTRNKYLKDDTGSWNVLVSTYSLLKEGIDIRELDTLHMVTPMKEKGLIVQCAGRIERPCEKQEPIVYDYVDINIPYCRKSYISRKSSLKNRFRRV